MVMKHALLIWLSGGCKPDVHVQAQQEGVDRCAYHGGEHVRVTDVAKWFDLPDVARATLHEHIFSWWTEDRDKFIS
jgi:hypothetical protein